MKKSKVEVSISLSQEVLQHIDDNYHNRSKFIQWCIIQELNKVDKFKEKIDKMLI